MSRLALLTLLPAIEALLDSGDIDRAKALIKEVIAEAKRPDSGKSV